MLIVRPPSVGALALNDRTLELLDYPTVIDRLVRLTTSAAGKIAARELRPIIDRDRVIHRQMLTAEALYLNQQNIGIPVDGVLDVRDLAQGAELGQTLTPGELLDIANTARTAMHVRRLLNRLNKDVPMISKIAAGIDDFDSLHNLIESSINSSNEVRDEASAELQTIRSEMSIAHDQLQQRMQALSTSAALRPVLQEPIVTIRDGRYVLPVKADFRTELPGVVHDISASGATVYIEPFVIVDLGNRWRELKLQERREVERILRELSQAVGAASAELSNAIDRLGQMDLALAKGRLARDLNATELHTRGCQPWLTEAPAELRLTECRHPLIGPEVVPNTIIVGGTHHALLITGPNTGGKTVALKTAGLLVLMALAGLPVPATAESTIPVFESVFADIGDEQSIEQSLSTFSSHMTAIIAVLEKANNKSFVLLDELGAGTDPTEGAALAVAIVEQLLSRGSSLIATTHHSELKLYAHRTSSVANASLEFDLESLSPTYKLTLGLAGQSNGLAIASNLGMPSDVINAARMGLSTTEIEFESILAELHARLADAKERASKAAQDAEEAEKIRVERVEELKNLASETMSIREDAQIQVRNELRKVRHLLQKTRKEVEASKLAKAETTFANAEQAVTRFHTIPNSAEPPSQEFQSSTASHTSSEKVPITLGATVWLRGVAVPGEVLSEPDDRDEFEVQLGSLRMRVRLEQVESINEPAQDHSTQNLHFPPTPWVPSEIEVRGQRIDEAVLHVEQFLDAASRSGHSRVRLIHGRGTGTLRHAVRELLDEHPLVTGYETAQPNEGGVGVTVANLASTS